jgi:hypothetical protein
MSKYEMLSLWVEVVGLVVSVAMLVAMFCLK